jgi:hypothetical protein
MNETETQIRTRRAKDALAECRAREDDARKALAEAIKDTGRAKERYHDLFLKNEAEICARRRTETAG